MVVLYLGSIPPRNSVPKFMKSDPTTYASLVSTIKSNLPITGETDLEDVSNTVKTDLKYIPNKADDIMKYFRNTVPGFKKTDRPAYELKPNSRNIFLEGKIDSKSVIAKIPLDSASMKWIGEAKDFSKSFLIRKGESLTPLHNPADPYCLDPSAPHLIMKRYQAPFSHYLNSDGSESTLAQAAILNTFGLKSSAKRLTENVGVIEPMDVNIFHTADFIDTQNKREEGIRSMSHLVDYGAGKRITANNAFRGYINDRDNTQLINEEQRLRQEITKLNDLEVFGYPSHVGLLDTSADDFVGDLIDVKDGMKLDYAIIDPKGILSHVPLSVSPAIFVGNESTRIRRGISTGILESKISPVLKELSDAFVKNPMESKISLPDGREHIIGELTPAAILELGSSIGRFIVKARNVSYDAAKRATEDSESLETLF